MRYPNMSLFCFWRLKKANSRDRCALPKSRCFWVSLDCSNIQRQILTVDQADSKVKNLTAQWEKEKARL